MMKSEGGHANVSRARKHMPKAPIAGMNHGAGVLARDVTEEKKHIGNRYHVGCFHLWTET
jgi:hypothetical protein